MLLHQTPAVCKVHMWSRQSTAVQGALPGAELFPAGELGLPGSRNPLQSPGELREETLSFAADETGEAGRTIL